MGKIRPFKALIFNPQKIEQLEKVVCPPYDIISPQAQKEYHERSPFNFIRVLLAKDSPGDNKYKRSAETFRQWLKSGLLLREELPAVYFYSQQYNIAGEKKIRLGFISLLKLDGNRQAGVFGHENTHIEAKEDRLRLIKQVKANLSPIFVIFPDKKRIIRRIFQKYIPQEEPFIEVTDDEKTVHRLWRLTQPDLIRNIEKDLESENMFIADGHHRYEVACLYRNLMRKKTGRITGEEEFDYVLSYFTNTDPHGLSILPIHRLLRLESEPDPGELRRNLSGYFDIDEIKERSRFFFLLQKAGCSEHLIGMYQNRRHWLLRLKNIKILDRAIAEKPKEYRSLDVSILNYLVFKSALKLDPDNLKDIVYSPQAADLIREVDADSRKIAFFLNPVKIEQIMAVALNGSKMPPKSTYFYPKILSGLLINKFGEG